MSAYAPLQPIPDTNFGLVLADSPWKTETWSDKGLGRSPERHYETMTVDEICALWGEQELSKKVRRDVWLALYCTPPHLENAFRVMYAWGFKYSTMQPWIKLDQSGQPVAGTGKVARGVSEPLIIARRGSPRIIRPLPGHQHELRRGHSQKPMGTHAMLERSFRGPALELFSRGTARRGWHFSGNQTGTFEESGT